MKNIIFRSVIKIVTIVLICSCSNTKKNHLSNEGFVKIFNGENWDGWYFKLRNGDEELANKVFAIDNEKVHVFKDMPDSLNLGTGENATHGLFYTKKKYSKYILRFEYKWGEKITNNFDRWQYDAGVYYHVVDDKIWPQGIEYQIRYDHTKNKNHTGDFITGGTSVNWYATKDSTTFLLPKHGGVDVGQYKNKMMLAKPNVKFNALNNEWNLCEIIVMGNKYAIHKLNGEIVNMGTDLSVNEGVIGFQSETVEIFYKNIEVKEFGEVVPMKEFIEL
ncbi:DUF1080 domain-containing protein [Seonamhaeicola sp. MEBiC1930]|uniref:3-keto-disaccharide hydrolase n=1 Tax=Seonamhaeicola sp. MEBiC01930 TaxID=2976768 RepID=UPI003253B9AF